MTIRTKRSYESPAPGDGTRILVDRLWPRGLTKEKARIDAWAKDAAPSNALRQWFGHDPNRWTEFESRYFKELDANPEAVQELRHCMKGRTVTLVFGAKDALHCNAVALKEYLEKRTSGGER